MKYKVRYIHETRSCSNIVEAGNFKVVRNTIVFYDTYNGRAIYAFNNVVSVEKVEEGEVTE